MRSLILCLVAILSWTACSEKFELFAPAKDIYIVYAILDADADSQFVRINKAYQYEGDAYEYAAENDLSVKGLTVKIKGGDRIWQASQIDSVYKSEGSDIFLPWHSLYYIDTSDSLELDPDLQYTIEITSANDPDLFLTAQCWIPARPDILSPRINGSGWQPRCLSRVPFEDSTEVIFDTEGRDHAMRYELKIEMTYQVDGESKLYRWGPTRLFSESVDCAGGSVICYKIGSPVVMQGLRFRMNDPDKKYTYQNTPQCDQQARDLPNDLFVQVTAIDSALSKYIIVNDPVYTSFNTVRREYTNLSGTVSAIGIFSAVAYDQVPILLTECAEYELRLGEFSNDPCQ